MGLLVLPHLCGNFLLNNNYIDLALCNIGTTVKAKG